MDQRNQEDQLHKDNDNCPANAEWWDKRSFYGYYKVAFSPGKVIHRLDCDIYMPQSKWAGREEFCDFRSQTWKRIPIAVKWQPGSLAIRNNNYPRDHWHTWFDVMNHHFHIDYISFFAGSNQIYCREYRVFMDGKFIERGGGYLGFLMAVFGHLRNWPLMAPFDQGLVYIKFLLQPWGSGMRHGDIKPEGALSVWAVA